MVKLALSLLAWTALTALVISEINPRKGLDDPLCHHHHVLKYGEPREVFQEWKQTYGSRYDENDWDDEHRFKIFQQNLAEIESHNWKYHTGQSTYFKGLNQFSAMTHDEFLRYTRQGRYSSRRGHAGTKGRRGGREDFECENDEGELRPGAAGLPERVNWTERGYVTPVKDQGDCGSCWTFGATGVMEGSYYKTHKKLVSFSEQQIMDCCDGEGCGGCNGGDQEAAYANVYDEGGIETEENYPYQEKKRHCRYNASDAVGRIQSCRRINPSGDELELQRSSATLGPISVSVDARFFSDYKGGVFNVSDCSPDYLDHAVLLTGYGTESKKPYWMVKNSWGQNWGCNGYIYMLRNNNNMCGIATEGTYVVMK